MWHQANFLKICFSPSLGEHYFANRHKGISLEKLPFLDLTPSVTAKCPLALSKNGFKTNTFSTFSPLGPTKPPHILTLAI